VKHVSVANPILKLLFSICLHCVKYIRTKFEVNIIRHKKKNVNVPIPENPTCQCCQSTL